ncbi:hypothetical protein J5N97_001908 [Dioscorea zingiberensis]|uniref:Uncharacterized protein n=1 Tax=Dioscorea zingiberensis TaxID=325984 RepID=A0A9D5BT43_9LILI|nr:hypothetical protein J5N97_001908 [Dioscorea zingiberensis]
MADSKAIYDRTRKFSIKATSLHKAICMRHRCFASRKTKRLQNSIFVFKFPSHFGEVNPLGFGLIYDPKKIAVVTGANKGIGLEISKQLASKGVGVVLTARDAKRGTEAAESLKASGFSDVVFHQLDVTAPTSIASFGKLSQNAIQKA